MVQRSSDGSNSFVFIFKIFYLFLERGEKREKRRETSMCERNIGCRSRTPSWDLGHNPGKCPDWEWDWQHFGS